MALVGAGAEDVGNFVGFGVEKGAGEDVVGALHDGFLDPGQGREHGGAGLDGLLNEAVQTQAVIAVEAGAEGFELRVAEAGEQGGAVARGRAVVLPVAVLFAGSGRLGGRKRHNVARLVVIWRTAERRERVAVQANREVGVEA